MEVFNTWLQGLIVSVIIATIIEMILPNGNHKKYIKVVLGVYVIFNMITPVVNQFSKHNFELSSLLNIEEYTKKMQTYETSSENIDITITNETNIKQIYLTNLKKDMKAKLEEKEYEVQNIEINLEDTEEYRVQEVSLSLKKKEEMTEVKKESNKVAVNEIQMVQIQVGETQKEPIDTQESKITEKEEKEIKEYLASVYEIKETQVKIN